MTSLAVEQHKHPVGDQEVAVVRQPIYANGMELFGYELLFRSSEENSDGLNPTKATAQVLESMILNSGFDEFILTHKAFINVTRAFIDVISDIQLPASQVILDIPRSIEINTSLISRLKELRNNGYGLSVDGVANLNNKQMLAVANYIRVDIQQMKIINLDTFIKRIRRYKNLYLRATKIETMEEYQSCRDKCFDYLQGYFISRPSPYISRSTSASKPSAF